MYPEKACKISSIFENLSADTEILSQEGPGGVSLQENVLSRYEQLKSFVPVKILIRDYINEKDYQKGPCAPVQYIMEYFVFEFLPQRTMICAEKTQIQLFSF